MRLLIDFSIKKNKDGSYSAKANSTYELNKAIDIIRSKEKIIKEIVPLKFSLEETFIEIINESNKEGQQ